MVTEIRCHEGTMFALILEPTNKSDRIAGLVGRKSLEENGIAEVRWTMKNFDCYLRQIDRQCIRYF
jgi:hypothetical protein